MYIVFFPSILIFLFYVWMVCCLAPSFYYSLLIPVVTLTRRHLDELAVRPRAMLRVRYYI